MQIQSIQVTVTVYAAVHFTGHPTVSS